MQTDKNTIPADDWRLAAVHGVAPFPGLPGQICGRSTLFSLGQFCKEWEQQRKLTGTLTWGAAGGHLWGGGKVALFLFDRQS